MTASLGTLLTTLRQEYLLAAPPWARHLGLPLERVQALEEDATLPTIEELHHLCQALDIRPTRLLRHVRTTGRRLLDRAWAHACTAVPHAAPPQGEAVLALPDPLQRSLCDALSLPRSDRDGLQQAWSDVCSRPEPYRTMLFEAALVQLTLEGERPHPPDPSGLAPS